ncbi:MAG: hemolysin family protein [Chloroflexota bacterium]|nr:hemolysin family protein [Chloroflexota bacterium]
MVESVNLAYLVVFFICLIISAFFASSETAFVSLQKVRIRHMVNSGVSGAEDVARMTEHPEKLLTTVLICNNFVNTAAAALGTMIAIDLLSEGSAVIVATVVVTIMLLIFSEIIPKTIATRMGERMALFYFRPIRLIAYVFSPITFVFSGIGVGVAKLFGASSASPGQISEDEIKAMISMGIEDGAVEAGEAVMMEKVFLFGDRQVGEIMTPRTDIVWVEKETSLDDFLAIYAENPHSRFPVYEETQDDILGVLWIKDVLMSQAKGDLQADSVVTGLARPPYFVPETKNIGEIFGDMQEQRTQITMIVDEYGGTAGLVTMEQLLEEIVGQLGDELATEHRNVETIDLNTYQINGLMRVDQANEELELGLPDGDYETVAGFILSELGHIPKEGEQLRCNAIALTVTEMKGVKIEKVLIIKE